MKTIIICCLSLLLLPTIPAHAQGILGRIEAKIGHELTVNQRRTIQESAQKEVSALKAEQDKFVVAIAGITKLPEEKIREFMPKIGGNNAGFDKNMIPKLEKALGRSLTTGEMEKIRAADKAKKAAMKPIQEEFAGTIAKVSGLKKEDALALLPKIGL